MSNQLFCVSCNCDVCHWHSNYPVGPGSHYTTGGVPGGWGSGHLLLLRLDRLLFPLFCYCSEVHLFRVQVLARLHPFQMLQPEERHRALSYGSCVGVLEDTYFCCVTAIVWSWLASSKLRTQERPEQAT